MKICFSIILIIQIQCCYNNSSKAQATGFDTSSLYKRKAVNLNLERDFGADPTGKKNSTWSFIKASRYIQNLWNKSGIPITNDANINYSTQYVILNIPWGNYKVGRQIDLKTFCGGIYYLYDSTNNVPSGSFTIPYYKVFPEANIDSKLNSSGLTIYPYQYKLIDGGNGHYYTIRYLCSDIFSVNNNKSNYLNGIIIQDTADGIHVSGVVNIKDSDNLRIGYIDSAHANDTGIARFGYIRFAQTSFLSSFGPITFNFGYPWGPEPVNKWSDSAIMNVKIQGINIDGNNVNYYFGGRQQLDNYWYRPQIGTYGITLYSTKNVTIQNCNINRFGTDGIYLNDAAYKSPTNIVIRNVTSDSNVRQGISVCGVNGLIIDSCNFSYAGRLRTIDTHGDSALFALPAAGMDIEPEAGMDIYHNYVNSKRGDFNVTVSNSVFSWNSVFNLCQIPFSEVNFRNGSDTNYYSKNWYFVNDIFENDTIHIPSDEPTKYQGLVIGQPFFKFKNCIINDIINPGIGTYYLPNGETLFDNCTFSDITSRGGYLPKDIQIIPNQDKFKSFKLTQCILNFH